MMISRRISVWIDDGRRDVAYAARLCRRAPMFTAAAAFTLAIGIGANTAVFSVVRAVLIRPLPFAHADRLVRIYEHVPAAESPDNKPRRMNGMSADDVPRLRSDSRTLTHVMAYGAALVTMAGGSDTVRLSLVPVTSDMFAMLEARPLFGRVFTRADEMPGSDRIVILSYAAWQRYFGGDPNAVGRTVRFNGSRFSGNVALGAAYTIVGVMPADFHFPDDRAQFWVPLALRAGEAGVSGGVASSKAPPRRTQAIARLADGVRLDSASAEASDIVAGAHAIADRRRIEFVPLTDEIGEPVRSALLILTAAVALVLLIACANVASLLLARTASRQREIATRIAVGASRGRLVRQLITEGVVLSAIGGVAGTLLAIGGVSLFRTLAANLPRVDLGSNVSFPRLDSIQVDVTMWLCSLALSSAAGVLFGLVPALEHTRSIAPAGSVASAGRAQRTLVVAEIAMATVLAVGAILLIRSFGQLTAVKAGFDPAHVVTFQVSLPGAVPPIAAQKTFAENLTARLRDIPAVRAAAYANQLPMVALRDTAGGFSRSRAGTTARRQGGPDARLVSRDYFQTMGIRVLSGRGLTDGDDARHPRVLVINHELARRDFAGENPIGQVAYVGNDPNGWRIVGIVDDVRQFGLDRTPEPQLFADVRQWPDSGPVFPIGAYYAIRVDAPPAVAIGRVRAVLNELSADASIDNVATMDAIVANSTTRPRLYAVLLGVFAAAAVLLAAAGIYAVMAYAVAARTREIGIRLALGARPSTVLAMVMGQSATLTTIGIVLGMTGAAAASRYLEGFLFGVTPSNPRAYLEAATGFAAVAMLASFVAAQRATSVDPSVALRAE